MVAAVSRSANSQNTIQPRGFLSQWSVSRRHRSPANNMWLPDQSGRWFYERARGSYNALQSKSSSRAGEKRRVASETPPERRFSKMDLAKYLNAWDGRPNLVSYGNQKNFQSFMQALKAQSADGFTPDEEWFRAFVAKAIIFRTIQSAVKAKRFPAYQANITAYTVASLSWRCGGRLDFDYIWSHQSLSNELRDLIENVVPQIGRHLRDTAGARVPSEWAKKEDCWGAMRKLPLAFPDPLPPELQVQST